MTDRFAVLDDIEDLLWESTAQTITESLERGEHPEHGDRGDELCAWCGHAWHGLPCQPVHWTSDDAGHLTAAYSSCGCVNAATPLDDTWRPATTQVDRLMAAEGLDGYAARALTRQRCGCALCRYELRRRAHASVDREFLAAHLIRWTPDITVVRPRRAPHYEHMHVAFGGNLTGFTQGLQALADAMQLDATQLGDFQRALTGYVDDLRPQPAEQPPVDPRARALAHQQQRNTGPARPTAGHAHRPRRHT